MSRNELTGRCTGRSIATKGTNSESCVMILQGLRNWRAARLFKNLPAEQAELVFYAEDGAAWRYLGPIVEELATRGVALTYLTSSPVDPILEKAPAGVTCFCIGSGTARTALFLELSAKVMVMTMPDLETFHIKRSAVAPVHYVYVPHTLASTHMISRPAAFDHFDTVFCVGPHHVREIRARESLYGLKLKELVEHGYGPLDTIRAQAGSFQQSVPLKVLVAPSWGGDGILETRGVELVGTLLEGGFDVTVRPHPRTRRYARRQIAELGRAFSGQERFTLEADTRGIGSLLRSDLMISDWSGVALEFAFGLGRPVVFLDLPRKVNNPNYRDLGIEPFEVTVREEVGEIVGPERISELPALISRLCSDPQVLQKSIARVRERCVFNPGRSAVVAADRLQSLLARQVV